MKTLFKENKAFRLLLGYQFFSSLGGAIFSFFMMLSVHLLYQNPVYTGIAGFFMTVPFIFAVGVGPIIDRGNKVAIIRFTALLEFAVLAALALASRQESMSVVFMLGALLLYSIVGLFNGPASSALRPQVVGKDKIMEANSLIQIVTLIGGIGIAVLLFSSLGEGVDFTFLYGLSAAFVGISFIFSLLLKNPTTQETTAAPTSYIEDLKAGARFVRHNVLLYLTIAIVAKAFVIQMVAVNMPAFAEYHVGAQGYVVFAVVGMGGGLLASSLIGMFGKRAKISVLFLGTFAVAGIARIAFVHILPDNYHLGLGILLLYAALSNATGLIFQSLEQKIPPKDMVARVDTLSGTIVSVFVSLGALAGGFIGRTIPNVANIFVYQGIAFIAIGLLIFLVPAVRKLGKMDEI